MNAKNTIHEMNPKNAIKKIISYIETTKKDVDCTQLFETIQQVRLLELYIDNLKKNTDEIKDRFEKLVEFNNNQLLVITNQYKSIISVLPQNKEHTSPINTNNIVNDSENKDSELNNKKSAEL